MFKKKKNSLQETTLLLTFCNTGPHSDICKARQRKRVQAVRVPEGDSQFLCRQARFKSRIHIYHQHLIQSF